jgi:putative colanic acid biosynthesis acetyltransferase WcaF
MRLDLYDNTTFNRGRPAWIESLWLLAQALFMNSWLPGSALRVWLLRRFGATIGCGVVIKPRVRVKFPWRLSIGDHVWIGEDTWIDNLALVTIASHCCISQGVYICTGSHNWRSVQFDLITRPIEVGNHAWICAKAVVGPGVCIGEGAVLTLGSIATGKLAPWTVYAGAPAQASSRRSMDEERSAADSKKEVER